VGSATGDTGAGVGFAVGAGDGEGVGGAVGSATGDIGAGVGFAVGRSVGKGVGTGVGPGIGDTGAEVGLAVGRGVGKGVGRGAGFLVGEGVAGGLTLGVLPVEWQKDRNVTAADLDAFSWICLTLFLLMETVCTELSPRRGTLIFSSLIPLSVSYRTESEQS
jgi:hypothetical protein